jgi:UDP-N-acetylglucosamine 2-epimerase (non-hydrolysing)
MVDLSHDPLRLAVISTSRSDFGLLAPVAQAAQRDRRFDCVTIITGLHLSAGTPRPEELDGLTYCRLPPADASLGSVHQRALLQQLTERRCEVALILGDRHELLEVVQALTLAGVIIAHCSGGERTLGAIDDLIRDAVTRLSHLHFPVHAEAGHRLINVLGEESRRVHVTGEPGLDALLTEPPIDPATLRQQCGHLPSSDDLCIAIHPVTRDPQESLGLLDRITALAARWPGHLYLSTPNGDPGSDAITDRWNVLVQRHPHCHVLPSLGSRLFRTVVRCCGVLVGNSSAGLIEAPSLGTPSVNLGTRQRGRTQGPSVVDCPVITDAALDAAIAQARRFSASKPFDNPYGDGHAVPRILEHLLNTRQCDPTWTILVKP